MLTKQQIQHFSRFGYLVLPKAIPEEQRELLKKVTEYEIKDSNIPLELESDLQYPGAPRSLNALGGKTIRRLLGAYSRHHEYKKLAESDIIVESLKSLLRSEKLYLSLAHHNCIMTKHPLFSSSTGWHRDTRYWNFNNKYLINAWIALGDEHSKNGGMSILPGSHLWDEKFDVTDNKQFLIDDHPSNAARLALANSINLNAGDCLLFSAHCFHTAGANHTNSKKLSVVFSYHGQGTQNRTNPSSSMLIP